MLFLEAQMNTVGFGVTFKANMHFVSGQSEFRFLPLSQEEQFGAYLAVYVGAFPCPWSVKNYTFVFSPKLLAETLP